VGAVSGVGEVYTVGAFRVCGQHPGCGIAYRAVLESTGPRAVFALLAAAHAAGVRCGIWPLAGAPGDRAGSRASCREHFAVLDVVDREGDIVGDYCIPTAEAWEWWARAAELRQTGADCGCGTVSA
jgi:hypothetical protein